MKNELSSKSSYMNILEKAQSAQNSPRVANPTAKNDVRTENKSRNGLLLKENKYLREEYNQKQKSIHNLSLQKNDSELKLMGLLLDLKKKQNISNCTDLEEIQKEQTKTVLLNNRLNQLKNKYRFLSRNYNQLLISTRRNIQLRSISRQFPIESSTELNRINVDEFLEKSESKSQSLSTLYDKHISNLESVSNLLDSLIQAKQDSSKEKLYRLSNQIKKQEIAIDTNKIFINKVQHQLLN